MAAADAPILRVTARAELRAWLEEHAATSTGVWIVTRKGAERTITYAEVVEELLCVGWIDGQARGVDDRESAQYIAPRTPRSGWSGSNKERIERLEADGLLRPAGIAAVALAKETGRWTALDESQQGVEPPDLTAALDEEPAAREVWDGFPKSARRTILEWISTARTVPTRERRISLTVSEAIQGRRANEWPRPKRDAP